jgi:hypothetical protein
MFEIRTYLKFEGYDYTDLFYRENPSAKYIEFDNTENISKIIDHHKFSPEYTQELITITYYDKDVVGFDVPSGLNLWKDSFIPAFEKYLTEGKITEVMYGIEPITLKLEPIANNQVSFSIFLEFEPEKPYASEILPEKEFISSILNGASDFWNNVIEYKIFERKEIGPRTPEDLPYRMLEKVEELRKRIS